MPVPVTVAPLPTVTGELASEPVTASVPPATVVGPDSVFVPLSNCAPVPASVSGPVPDSVPAKVLVPAVLTVSGVLPRFTFGFVAPDSVPIDCGAAGHAGSASRRCPRGSSGWSARGCLHR